MKVFLRAIEPEDYKLLHGWRTDSNYGLTTSNRFFVSGARTKSYIENLSLDDKQKMMLGICLIETNVLIGFCTLQNIDYINRHVELGGILIGDNEHKQHGYAKQALQLLLDYVFGDLNMNKLYGNWHEDNETSVKWFQRLGFKYEGKLRQHLYKSFQFYDIIIMSLLAEEYRTLRSQ